MSNPLARVFSPPAIGEENENLAALKLWAVLMSLIATVTALFLIMLPLFPENGARIFGYLAVYDGEFVALLVLARSGRIRLAAWILIIGAVIITTASVWTAGGVRAPGLMAFLLMIEIAGLLLGSLAAVGMSIACGAISLFLLVAERRAILPAPTLHHTATSVWLVFMLVMVEFVVIQKMVGLVVARAERQARADAAERQRVASAHRESEEKFAKMFRASPDAIVITDLETGKIVEANPSYEELFGYARSELIGRSTVDLGIFESADDRRRLVEAVRSQGAIRDREMYACHRDRRRIPLLFSGELIELGDRTCMVSIIHDITGRKQAEARERQTRDEFTRRLIASQEAERRRIAAELHDSLGQNLILIKNRAQLAIDQAAAAPALRTEFESLREMAAQAIAEVRQISHDLRPNQLDQVGLTRALEAMIEAAAASSKFPITRQLDPVDDLFTPEAATHVYRVAQECISNILKHAQARSARVLLERDVREVCLWIEDDGRGFTAVPGELGLITSGLGLSSIAERVRILGGKLKIDSRPGQGARIEVRIPHAGTS